MSPRTEFPPGGISRCLTAQANLTTLGYIGCLSISTSTSNAMAKKQEIFNSHAFLDDSIHVLHVLQDAAGQVGFFGNNLDLPEHLSNFSGL